MLQALTPSPAAPGSGVPAAAACHSALVSRRLPWLAQAATAWNQVAKPDGVTPATLRAYILLVVAQVWPMLLHG